MKRGKTLQHGFSLVEMTIALVIIGTVLGLSLTVGKTQIEVAGIKSTNRNLEIIRESLLQFQQKQLRFPCPAVLTQSRTHANYGLETSYTTDCSGVTTSGNAVIGFIPFKTLGLPEEIAYDYWEHRILYVIDRNHVRSSSYSDGNLQLDDINNNPVTASSQLGKAIFIVISHGKDGKGGYNQQGTIDTACGSTTKDAENCDNDSAFIDTAINEGGSTAANLFNDHVLWYAQERIEAPGDAELLTINTLGTTGNSTCAINNSRQLFCTGNNGNGRLANNSTTASSSFVQETNLFNDWIEIDVNAIGGCGIRANGNAYCWGENGTSTPSASGRVGDGTTTTRLFPTLVINPAGNTNPWTEISTSGFHSCGIKGGRAYCWGYNWYGNIGDNTSANHRASPVEVTGVGGGASYTNWTSITAAEHFSCGIAGGRAYCWGLQTAPFPHGQLGNGTGTNSITPVEVSGGFTDWKYINATTRHVCAIRKTGLLYCWGSGSNGKLGDNNTVDRTTPVLVANGFRDWKYVFASEHNTCAIRGRGKNLLYCWGFNQYGYLGVGDITQRLVPTLVLGGFEDWVAVVNSGYEHACGARANGSFYCWGRNVSGSWGNGATSGTNVTSPAAVGTITVKTN